MSQQQLRFVVFYNNENHHEDNEALLKESKSMIPVWMDNYIDWHARQRRYNNLTNETRYLVVRCLVEDKCGGISDRFKPLPFYILLANATNRVLLIHWDKPAHLENFLIPPKGGIDWRLDENTNVTLDEIKNPDTFFNGFCHQEGISDEIECVVMHPIWRTQRVLSVLARGGLVIHKWNALFHMLNEIPPNEIPQVRNIVHRPNVAVPSNYDLVQHVFRLLFEPTPAIANAVSTEMSRMRIRPKHYVTAHVRAKSPKGVPKDVQLGSYGPGYGNNIVDMRGGLVFEGKAKEFIVSVVANAVRCANSLAPGLPIYVVSDTNDAVQYMIQQSSNNLTSLFSDNKSLTIVAANRSNDTLHVDYHDPQRDISEYYPTFVDLLIMSKAKCASHGIGGFGVFPIRIGGINCSVQHRDQTGLHTCPEPTR